MAPTVLSVRDDARAVLERLGVPASAFAEGGTPARSPVGWPFSYVSTPFTHTASIPCAGCCGFSNVAASISLRSSVIFWPIATASFAFSLLSSRMRWVAMPDQSAKCPSVSSACTMIWFVADTE